MHFMTLPKAFQSLFAAFCACALFLSVPAAAQTRQSELETISRQMFREGNERFILVEAMKDGFIVEGRKYDLQYANDVVKIDGKPLREPFQKHYNGRLKKFAMIESERTGANYKLEAMHGKGPKYKDVINPASDFRTVSASAKHD